MWLYSELLRTTPENFQRAYTISSVQEQAPEAWSTWLEIQNYVNNVEISGGQAGGDVAAVEHLLPLVTHPHLVSQCPLSLPRLQIRQLVEGCEVAMKRQVASRVGGNVLTCTFELAASLHAIPRGVLILLLLAVL